MTERARPLFYLLVVAILLAGCGTNTEPRSDYSECYNDRNAGAICIKHLLCGPEDCDDDSYD